MRIGQYQTTAETNNLDIPMLSKFEDYY